MKNLVLAFSVFACAQSYAVRVTTVPMVVDSFFRGAWEVTVHDAPDDAAFEVLDGASKRVAGPFSVDTFQVVDVEPWSDEHPSVYRLAVSSGGETHTVPFGFRTREIARRSLFVNGRRVRVKLGPAELGGNAAPDDGSVTREEALSKGIYLLSPEELERIDCLRALDCDGATRHLFQNWSVSATNHLRRIAVANRNAFTGSESLRMKWTVLRDGEEESSGFMDMLSVPPGAVSVRDMPTEVFEALFTDGSVAVRFEVVDGRRVLSSDQIEMMQTRDFSWIGGERGSGRVSFSETADSMEFAAGKTRFSFSKTAALSVTMSKKGFFGESVALEGLFPCILGVSPRSQPVLYPVSSVDESEGVLSFFSRFSSSGRDAAGEFGVVDVSSRWSVYPNGRIGCVCSFDRRGAGGRSGMGFVVSGEPSSVEWYGLGPWCTVPGAVEGAFSGRWKAEIRDGMTFEEVRGVKIGDFTLRTLRAPLSIAVLSRDGKTILLAFPGKGDDDLAVALSPSGDSLGALSE